LKDENGITEMNIYDYQRPLGKIDDAPELRNEFITVYDGKDKAEAVRFGLLFGNHIIEITGFEPCEEVNNAFRAMQRWLNKETSYHEARNIAFGDLCKQAREENDAVKERFYKTMMQIACIPHCKYHALWAADFAVTLVNRMYPNDIDEVEKERSLQIELFRKTKCN
jgi:hypothetical protein